MYVDCAAVTLHTVFAMAEAAVIPLVLSQSLGRPAQGRGRRHKALWRYAVSCFLYT